MTLAEHYVCNPLMPAIYNHELISVPMTDRARKRFVVT